MGNRRVREQVNVATTSNRQSSSTTAAGTRNRRPAYRTQNTVITTRALDGDTRVESGAENNFGCCVKPNGGQRHITREATEELRIDGWRAVALINDGECDLVSRTPQRLRRTGRLD